MFRTCLIVAVTALALTGCATLNRQECEIGDWRGIGFDDGARGFDESRLGEHREACSRFGVAPNLELWRDGYFEGLGVYCRPENALQLGIQGATYRGVCDGPDAAAFVPAYRDGLLLHEANERVNRARADVSNARSRIDSLKRDIENERRRSTDPNLTQAERDSASQRVIDLTRELGRTEGELSAAERAIWPLEREADDIRDMLFSRYPGWMR